MVSINEIKNLHLVSKERLIIPISEDSNMNDSCIVLISNNDSSISRFIKLPILSNIRFFNHVYIDRNISIMIKNIKKEYKNNIERIDYYKKIKNYKLTGQLTLGKKNTIFDTYIHHRILFNNIDKLNENDKCITYIEMIKKILSETFRFSINSIMFDINELKETNIFELISYGLKHHLDLMSEINSTMIFLGKFEFFKLDIKECNDKSYLEFDKLIEKIIERNNEEKDNIKLKSELNEDEDELISEDELKEDELKKSEKEESEEETESEEEKVVKLADKILEPVDIKKTSLSKRDMDLREKQKKLKVDNITLDDLKIRSKDTELELMDISKDINTLNEDITKTRFSQFDKTYNEKYYDRDIISIADCLKDKPIPVFIRDLKKEDTSDSLNMKYTYTFYLEDSLRGRHTLKFDVPKFIDGKYMYLNGHKKQFSNQRFLKPLVKTGPDTVQVCTNYNKIFIYRYGEKVEALYEKFAALVTQDKNFKYKFGDCSKLNSAYKTTIEYDTLAKKFSEITVLCKPNLHLIFSQPRLKEIAIKMGKENEWNKIIEMGHLCCGYYDDKSLFTVNPDVLDITQESYSLEDIGDPFAYVE